MDAADTADDAGTRELAAVSGRAELQIRDENFPVALRLLPRAARDQLIRVYRYARFVDDVGDEAPGSPEHRLHLLDRIEGELDGLTTGTATLAPVVALAPLVARGVPLQLFRDLLEANRMDQHRGEYADFDDLLGYCRLSAAPVGRIVLHVAGAATELNVADSDAVCNALQVLEHCQDVGQDARMGRVYLPADDLRAAGVDHADLLATVTSPPLRAVVEQQVGRAENLLTPGRALVGRLSGWSRVAVAGYVAGGRATARALRAGGFDVLGRPLRPSKAHTVGSAISLVAGASVRRRGRS